LRCCCWRRWRGHEPRPITTWATARLDALVAGAAPPPVVATIRLGALDAWGEGWARKRFEPATDQLNGDGSLLSGLIAALADQMLAFAAMTVVPFTDARYRVRP